MRALQPNLDYAPHSLECGSSLPLWKRQACLVQGPQQAAGQKAAAAFRRAAGTSTRRTPYGFAVLGRGLLLAAIRLYQAFLSPVAFSACKFHPSCSRYAYEAIERHGARRGVRLALNRLWRCRPFARGGYDPVPESLEEVQ